MAKRFQLRKRPGRLGGNLICHERTVREVQGDARDRIRQANWEGFTNQFYQQGAEGYNLRREASSRGSEDRAGIRSRFGEAIWARTRTSQRMVRFTERFSQDGMSRRLNGGQSERCFCNAVFALRESHQPYPKRKVRELVRMSLLICIWLTWGPHVVVTADDESPNVQASVQAFTPGEIASITALGKHSVTYHVSVPDKFEVDASPMPLLVVFSPGGNGMGLLEKLRAPANSAGWFLVGCDKLRNGMDDHATEVEMEDEVLDHILANVPHDPARIYLGGFSGGGMRAFGITARRNEPYAGILSYGGWLGGPDYQGEPYRENMSVAMLTGTRDRGASGWIPIDTRALRKRNCTVKHFSFAGGHTVAPTEVTRLAIEWQEQQWKARQAALNSERDSRINLSVLYVGTDESRTKDFASFLRSHFQSVATTTPSELTLQMSNRADVLLLDSAVRSLPDGYTKAMLMVGSSAALTGERYGSKIDWLCKCLDNEAYAVDQSHPIFAGPLPVVPTLVEKRCPHSGMKIQAWKVEEPQEEPGLVASRKHFAFAKDSEIISSGVNMKGINGVPLVREAHRFLWGFIASPENMTEEGRRVFVNSLAWIHEFDGETQTVFAGLHTRDSIKSVLDSPYVDRRNLNRWFEKELIDQTDGDKEAIRKHFEGRSDYVHVPAGSGLLQVDKVAEQLGTPIDEPSSIDKWIDLLDGEQSKLAFGLLQRYTQQRIRRKPQQWRDWLESNRDRIEFSEERGYRFLVRDPESKAVKQALPERTSETELTEISPILFEPGLAALHVVDGVAYQYVGGKVTIVIRAQVKDGWHFYSTDHDRGTTTPTKIEIELSDDMKFVGPWRIPPSSDGELGDGVIFEREIRVGKTPVDKTMIKGSIQFQACTKERCLRPQTFEFSLPVTVIAK